MFRLIDVTSLVNHTSDRAQAAAQIGAACRECGFFYIVGHGVPESLCVQLETLSRQFFAQSESEKMRIAMSKGGRAWRGYFPVGNELTSGRPDRKEGIYFGAELPADHPAVAARRPLHGPNLFPEIPGFRASRASVPRFADGAQPRADVGDRARFGAGRRILSTAYTTLPLILFRIFHYPHAEPTEAAAISWGVGEHTDYGLLTILHRTTPVASK